VQFHFVVTGYEGKPLPLKWELFDARSGDQVGESRAITVKAQSNRDEGDWHAWVPLPQRRGRFFVLVQILDPEGVVPLAQLQTPDFPGLGERS
jgi:hypothetical protein